MCIRDSGWDQPDKLLLALLAFFSFGLCASSVYPVSYTHLDVYKRQLAGFTLTVTPGKAGEAVRSLYLHQYGVSYAQSLAALFVERLLDVLAMSLLALLILLARPEYAWLVILAWVLTAPLGWLITRALSLIHISRFEVMLDWLSGVIWR